jgi:hypothetical protein
MKKKTKKKIFFPLKKEKNIKLKKKKKNYSELIQN